ncbi:MAG TPA: carboxypeptidase regulatory-like domain-containing protein [Anaerolineales bacterium]|nr:carboxypeptidase regulatory-like domain-containing protein [Anaerolineales bacterium]
MKSPSVLSRRILLFILILSVSSQACAITLIEWPKINWPDIFPTSSSNPTVPAGPTATPLPRAEVTFTVRLPDPLPAGEVLAISILDEVTGLALNPVDYQMTASDPITFTTTLAIPDQAVIKYRYIRLGGSRVNEDTNLDGTIRYRMVRVSGPTQIVDTVSSWADKPVGTLSGSIMGTVLNASTGVPIPDILVTAGGVQTLTDSAGRFELPGLRGGAHNFVAYALDGAYQTFQQGAVVAENQSTPVEVRMAPAQMVNVIFTVSVPAETQRGVPLRIAGNLLQLGNTFSDLQGGLSTVADRMPVLSPLPDGRYSVSLSLPAGADIQYKYTLGDGFWNSEFSSTGQYVTRHLIVPAQNINVEDVVQSWRAGPNGPILFEVTVPQNTPTGDIIYIQFNPYSWTPAIPMWSTGPNKWAYKLYGPLNIVGSFGYRYCRNAQCDSADDAQTPGPTSRGHTVTPSLAPQDIIDTVREWMWPQNSGNPALVATDIPSRGTTFVAGVELASYYVPSMPSFVQAALQNIQAIGANWVFFTPSWTYVRSNPLIFSEQLGKDPFWSDTVNSVKQARAINMNVAVFPEPRFATNANEFWRTAPRDPSWWNTWFDHYRAFAVHHADLASLAGAQALVIGGDWIAPALPGGTLADGTPSGVPADAETRWRTLIGEVRQHFRGNLMFALPYDTSVIAPPISILTDVDTVYLLWFARLSDQPSPNKADLLTEAGRLLDNNVAPIQTQVNKPFVIGLSYPSSTYSATGCIPNGSGGCQYWTALSRPNADLTTVSLDLQQQVDIYDAVFNAINVRSWIGGMVSRGYFAPVALQDKSASIHGKPAADLVWYWYPRLLGNVK